MKLLSILLILASALLAQDPTQAPPPTYDYDSAAPGVQGPKSPLLAGYTYRSFRAYQVAVPVIVPVADLQAILPSGYIATPTVSGGNTTTVTLNFILDQRFQPDVTNPTTYGPTSALLVTATVTNSNRQIARQEIIFPCFEASADVDKLNAVFGANTTRLAKVTASATEEKGMLKFAFEISDSGIGLDLTMSAEAPDTLNTRAASDPVAYPFRAFTGLVPDAAFYAASQADAISVPTAAAKLKLHSPGHRLYFPAGALSILDFGTSVTFSRGVEFMLKFE
jgi:hypothetical protein